MTNDVERTSMSQLEPEFSKQNRNKNATRLHDESKNPCVKVTLMLQRLLCGHVVT